MEQLFNYNGHWVTLAQYQELLNPKEEISEVEETKPVKKSKTTK
jgi:hypothetical protein